MLVWDRDLLYDLAAEFRRMIVSAIEEDLIKDVIFKRFPEGCCGDASDLLGQYLLEHDIQTWNVVGQYYYNYDSGFETHRDIQTHNWLTTENPFEKKNYLIIDITGDQFYRQRMYGYFDIPVYVGRMDNFHGLFKFGEHDVYRFEGIDAYDYCARGKLWGLYKGIVGDE